MAILLPGLLIEGCYAVREGSPMTVKNQVDAEGLKVVVGQGSAYDLFLTRELKHANDASGADFARRRQPLSRRGRGRGRCGSREAATVGRKPANASGAAGSGA